MKRHLKLTLACGWLLCLFASAPQLSAATITDPPGGGAFSGEASNKPSPEDYFWTPDSDGRMDLSASAYGPFDLASIEVKANGQPVSNPNRFQVVAGVNYVITVSTSRGANHDLRWTFTPSAPNDKFVNAIDISSPPYSAYSGFLEGNAEVATDELPENDPAPARDVWFRWVAPEDGKANFGGNCGGACSVVLVVYRGTSLTNLVNVSGGERLGVEALPVTADTTYYIALRAGAYSLTWSFNPDAPSGPRRLWTAGRDLVTNEKRNDTAEQTATNARVPEWSYGTRAQAAGTALTLFRSDLHVNGTEGFEGWRSTGANEGILVANVKSTAVASGANAGQVFPQQLLMHPSSSNAFAVARWTAPADGWYRIYAEWRDLDANGGNGASGHVVINGREVFGRKVPADQFGPERFVGLEWDNGGNAAMAAETFKLKAGDVVDFALGSRGEASFDTTTFNSIVRRVPGIEITNAPPQSRTAEGVQLPQGADVTLEAQIDSPESIQSVVLRVNGRLAATDTSAPYSLTETNLEPGFYSFDVAAVDAAGVEARSETINVNVLAMPSAAAARTSGETSKEGAQKALAANNGGRTYTCTQSGSWENPDTWGGEGVPGRNDYAVIPGGLAVNAQDVEVDDLTAWGTLVIGSPGAPRRFVVYDKFYAGGIVEGGDPSSQLIVFNRMDSLTGAARFRALSLFVSGEIVLTSEGGIDAVGCVIVTSGRTRIFSPPGTNRPTVLRADQVQLNGGLHSLGDYGRIIAPAGLISDNGAALISENSGALISESGSTLIGTDGASLVGTDGASLIGTDGATLIGTDGATLIGTDGASVIGTDGASVISDNGLGVSGTGRASKNASPPETTIRREATGSTRTIKLQSGTISGKINLVGNVVNSGGFISPGDPTGRIKVKGDYTQEAGGTLLLEVGGTDPGKFDQLQIEGHAQLGGNLIVKTIGGHTPQAGQTVSPVNWKTAGGSFETISSNARVQFGPNGFALQIDGPNPPAPKALNIATRMRVETGDNVLIAGFIIAGSQPKKVLVRGIGPTLPVADALADPTLDLDAGTFFNDDWRSDQEQEIRDTTIPPLSNVESAIVATLDPGPHTAVLRGFQDETGVGLVEVYDLETGSPVQLANISTRGQVQTGDNVMIGGFIISGNYPAKVLLRAIGPSLPVAGALQDPTLELVDSNGASIKNNDWRETQKAEIFATTVPPTNNKESAIVATLVPGAYTAVVRGKDDTVGVALVEGYTLP